MTPGGIDKKAINRIPWEQSGAFFVMSWAYCDKQTPGSLYKLMQGYISLSYWLN